MRTPVQIYFAFDEVEVVERAAREAGMSRSAFVVRAAVEAARELIGEVQDA